MCVCVCMLQIVSTCDTSYDQTGASVVATLFLSVFVLLILSDALLTAFALNRALTKDDRELDIIQRINEKERELKIIQTAIGDLCKANNTQPSASTFGLAIQSERSASFSTRGQL